MALDPAIAWAYHHARNRCNSTKNKSYKDYGGRGIKFLFSSINDFSKELGPKPVGYQLDRINNNGNYEIGNIRWASKSEQMINRRPLKNKSSGITGITFHTHYENGNKFTRWLVRKIDNNKRKTLYTGHDFFVACCVLKSWENKKCLTTL